jgi:hypothetical protein
MPPLQMIVDVLLYAVLPAALTAAVVMAIVALAGGRKLAPLGAALGLAGGVVVGRGVQDLERFLANPQPEGGEPFHFLHGLRLMPGDSPWNHLPWAALAALLVGLLARLPRLPAGVAWSLRWAAAVVLVSWVLPARLPAETWWVTPALTLVIVAQWALLEHLAATPPGGSVPLALALTAFGAGGVLIYASMAQLMDTAVALGAALAGIAAVSWLGRVDGGGAVPGAAVLLPGLLLMGQQEMSSEPPVPWLSFALAAGAPFLLALTLLPPLRAWQAARHGKAGEAPGRLSWAGIRLGLVRVALLVLPLGGAVALAHIVAGPLVTE